MDLVMKYAQIIFMLLFGYRVEHLYKGIEDIDYSEYLGPNWKQNKFKGKRVSTLVSNHYGILDIFAYVTGGSYCSYMASTHVKDFKGICGLGGFYCSILQCIYADRYSSKEVRDAAVDTIMKR